MRTEMPSQKQCIHLVLLMAFVLSTLVTADYVEIKSTGSSVIGGTVNFSAVLYDDGQVASTGDYMFNWEDNTPAANNVKINTKYPYSNWSVTYPMNTSKPGDYRVTLKVDKNYILWINIATNHIDFKLDDSLGGDMLLLQNDTKPRKNFISTAKPVNHTIQLRPNDAKLIADKAYEVHTYWFRNCTYIGVINGLSYVAQYTEPDQYYKIEALVVASFEKPPEPITTTTTTTTTTPMPTTTPATTTTTHKPNNDTTTKTPTVNPTTLAPRQRRRRGAAAPIPSTSLPAQQTLTVNTTVTDQTHDAVTLNTTTKAASKKVDLPILMSPLLMDGEPPYNCVTGQLIGHGPKNLTGLFKHYVESKAPVSDFKANGQNWLQRGDMMRLQVNCKGSPSLEMCIQVFNAPYNATGNETCRYYFPLEKCEYNYTRFFYESKTVLFFIRNDVSEKLNQVTINIYEAKVQSQLSVVVVPVSFTLIAVILIVFGVSYYLQSRNRFTVEVADFNFGETQSVDMEYKTFQQRLIESIREVWPRQRRYSEFNSDMEPEFDHSGRIGGAFDNSEQRPNVAAEENENNATTSAGSGNTTIDSNLRYNALT
ncbi:uncharacterized protein LOC126751633 [Bactrocera neohumeralis]|uniref:uncharacterized protein LOC120776074 n=1 Tax=Bactrocera tryoni TaxID=59916 RepID=UPI001A95E919|nr:uncharacterized protein LOC120776074 [Bactrocera tryoni]XP_050317998.1 uncharacterized protein LOC126751633 [Bactrocera neohumeralis]